MRIPVKDVDKSVFKPFESTHTSTKSFLFKRKFPVTLPTQLSSWSLFIPFTRKIVFIHPNCLRFFTVTAKLYIPGILQVNLPVLGLYPFPLLSNMNGNFTT